MRKIENLLVVGGDARQLYMAKKLAKLGFKAELYGFSELPEAKSLACGVPLADAVRRVDAVILPLPASRDGVYVNAPFLCEAVSLAELSEAMSRGQSLFAGMMNEPWKSAFFKKGICVYDYFEREELIIGNAVPTAEGVVALAMEKLSVTLRGSRCAVTGYGRTARILDRTLLALGAKVTVAARKCRDLAWAAAEGCEGVYLSRLHETADEYDLLVNTVPTLVVGEEILSRLRPDCVIIDIASAPYGVDCAAAAEIGLEVLCPGSLPGKVAPKTSGEIIADAVANIIEEAIK